MVDRAEVADMQDQVFELVRRGQEAVLDAGRIVTDRVSTLLPGEPEKVDDIIDTAFDIGERVMRGQREVARDIVDAVVAQLPDERGRR